METENMSVASLFIIKTREKILWKNNNNMKISLHIKFVYAIYGSTC